LEEFKQSSHAVLQGVLNFNATVEGGKIMTNEQVIECAIKDKRLLIMVEPHLKDEVAKRLGMRYDYSHITVEQAVGLGCKTFSVQTNEDEDGESWLSLHTDWGDLIR